MLAAAILLVLGTFLSHCYAAALCESHHHHHRRCRHVNPLKETLLINEQPRAIHQPSTNDYYTFPKDHYNNPTPPPPMMKERPRPKNPYADYVDYYMAQQ